MAPNKKQLNTMKALIDRAIRGSYEKQKVVFDKYPKEYAYVKKLAKI